MCPGHCTRTRDSRSVYVAGCAVGVHTVNGDPSKRFGLPHILFRSIVPSIGRTMMNNVRQNYCIREYS